MSFTREVPVRPIEIGDITVRVFGPGPSNIINPRAIVANIQVVLDDRTTRTKQVDLSDVLTANQVTQLNNLVDSIRTQAIAAMLPTP